MIAGGLGFIVLGAILTLIMPEHGFTPLPRSGDGALADLVSMFRGGVTVARGRPCGY